MLLIQHGLFRLFSVIDGFDGIDGSLHKNMQLMLEFLKGPLLVLHFSYYTLVTFLIKLSVIILSMLMILLFLESDLLTLNLIYETLWNGARSSLLISVREKLNWFRLTGLITLVLLM